MKYLKNRFLAVAARYDVTGISSNLSLLCRTAGVAPERFGRAKRLISYESFSSTQA